MEVKNLDLIIPDEKDFERVKGFEFRKQFGRVTFYGNGAPFQSEAEKMAKLIKDPEKLVKRAKAAASVWGIEDVNGYANGDPQCENVWLPFKKALEDMGFSFSDIKAISQYRK